MHRIPLQTDFPTYRGLKWIDAKLPTETEAWPKFGTRALVDISGDDYDFAREELREYANSRPWVWPDRTIFFFSDVHADTEAFLASLVASGGVEKTGPEDGDLVLTEAGDHANFVIGGDCFDKGPENLRLLRTIKHVIDAGAQLDILAGNHDVRALVGLEYMGRKEPELAHLFVRMGKKSIPLFKEVYDQYVASDESRLEYPSDREVRERFFPDESWYREFPRAVAGFIPEAKIEKEVHRIREKVSELQDRCRELDMTLGMVYAAAVKCRELFVEPGGEFTWYFERMELAKRAGSFLFLHAGVDDTMAWVLSKEGVEGLNRRFRRLVAENLFELYNGPVGNTFRTKYRVQDFPLTIDGVAALHRAGVYAIVHGHRNICRGQRMVMRAGLLNFECDASIDRNTRRIEGLQGAGAAVTIFRPSGTVIGVSADYPYAKALDAASVIDVTTIVKSDDRSCLAARAG